MSRESAEHLAEALPMHQLGERESPCLSASLERRDGIHAAGVILELELLDVRILEHFEGRQVARRAAACRSSGRARRARRPGPGCFLSRRIIRLLRGVDRHGDFLARQQRGAQRCSEALQELGTCHRRTRRSWLPRPTSTAACADGVCAAPASLPAANCGQSDCATGDDVALAEAVSFACGMSPRLAHQATAHEYSQRRNDHGTRRWPHEVCSALVSVTMPILPDENAGGVATPGSLDLIPPINSSYSPNPCSSPRSRCTSTRVAQAAVGQPAQRCSSCPCGRCPHPCSRSGNDRR